MSVFKFLSHLTFSLVFFLGMIGAVHYFSSFTGNFYCQLVALFFGLLDVCGTIFNVFMCIYFFSEMVD